MNSTPESVYPDFLKTGLGKLNLLDARRELLALFTALQYLRRDLHEQETPAGILEVGRRYVAGLELFRLMGFWLVNPKDMSFQLELAFPREQQLLLGIVVQNEIKSGRFGRALRRDEPVFFEAAMPAKPQKALFHSMAISSQVVGMFCGLLRDELAPVNEITFSLLSMILGQCADALATLHRTTQLTDQIETLSRLVPVCAWCKRVRNDSGYWEQIEQFISSQYAASITHGICPECEKRFKEGLIGT